jgi:uncharacterized cupin superfamily protein
MSTSEKPVAVVAAQVALRQRPPNILPPFEPLWAEREKRVLGDLFGLTNFGVNLVRLVPGGRSALRHAHARQDELVYVLEGRPTLVTDAGRTPLAPGMCAGFRAGTGDAHCLVNETDMDAVYLEVGDRLPGDAVSYPEDDLQGQGLPGTYRFSHKDGTPW